MAATELATNAGGNIYVGEVNYTMPFEKSDGELHRITHYYNSVPTPNHRVGVSISTDGGETWTSPGSGTPSTVPWSTESPATAASDYAIAGCVYDDKVYCIMAGSEGSNETVDVGVWDMDLYEWENFGGTDWDNLETSGKFSAVAAADIIVTQGSTPRIVAIFNGIGFTDMGTTYDKTWYNVRTLTGSWGTKTALNTVERTQNEHDICLARDVVGDTCFGVWVAGISDLFQQLIPFLIDSSGPTKNLATPSETRSNVACSAVSPDGSNYRVTYVFDNGSSWVSRDKVWIPGTGWTGGGDAQTVFTYDASGTVNSSAARLFYDSITDKLYFVGTEDDSSTKGATLASRTVTGTSWTEEETFDSTSGQWEKIQGIAAVTRSGTTYLDVSGVEATDNGVYWQLLTLSAGGGSLAPPSPLRYIAGHANLRR
jgi:hypothetical protein